MIELVPAQVTEALRALFVPDAPISLRCFAVLEGVAAGRILADDPAAPRRAVVQEAGFGTLYLGGDLDAPLLARIVAELRRERDVIACLWPDDPRLALLPPDPDYSGAALDFTDRAADDDLRRYLQVPTGCELRRTDLALLRRGADYDLAVAVFGSPERALERGLGYCLVQGDTILCAAFAGPPASGLIELGVTTHEVYRGRGYATVTCAHLVRECEQLGYRTYWNCAEQNRASAALARKLGYRTEREQRVLAWFTSRES